MLKEITLIVNGETYCLEVELDEILVDILREKLGLTGTKKGCATGDCGACTVILEGRAVTSCLVLAVSADGKKITTIEGLAKNGELHPLQQSFIDYDAVQCGFCTPGVIMMAKSILDENPDPTEEEVRAGIAGNLCRCTGYSKIVEAILAAAQILNGGAA
jgi:aerobic-type carbon monoxide dehydrogenase small subunit (CoxS/CutS family)